MCLCIWKTNTNNRKRYEHASVRIKALSSDNESIERWRSEISFVRYMCVFFSFAGSLVRLLVVKFDFRLVYVAFFCFSRPPRCTVVCTKGSFVLTTWLTLFFFCFQKLIDAVINWNEWIKKWNVFLTEHLVLFLLLIHFECKRHLSDQFLCSSRFVFAHRSSSSVLLNAFLSASY